MLVAPQLGPRLPCARVAGNAVIRSGGVWELAPYIADDWSHLVRPPRDLGFWLRFRCGPVLTYSSYSSTLRSGPRESLAKTRACEAGG